MAATQLGQRACTPLPGGTFSCSHTTMQQNLPVLQFKPAGAQFSKGFQTQLTKGSGAFRPYFDHLQGGLKTRKKGGGRGEKKRRWGPVQAALDHLGSDVVTIHNEPLDVEAGPEPDKVRQSILAPVIIGLTVGSFAYPTIVPWARAHLRFLRETGWSPVHVGFRPLDTCLGLAVQFYQDAFAVEWGPLALYASSALLLTWAISAGIESARFDSYRAPLVQFFSAVAPFVMFLGPGALVPVGWVAPYLSIAGNTTPGKKLPPRLADAKTLESPRVRAMSLVILLSAALYLLTGFQTLVNPLVLFLLPFVWQAAAAAAAARAPFLESFDTAVIGHHVAENILNFAAGIGIIQHALCVVALTLNPRLLASMARALVAPQMRARPAVFLLANFLGLWAGMLTIVAAQEGSQTALRTLLFGLLVGPAAATAFYLAAREAQIERREAQAAGIESAHELDEGIFGTGVVSEV